MTSDHLHNISVEAFNDELEKLGYPSQYREEGGGGGGVGGLVLGGAGAAGGYMYGKHVMKGAAKQMASKAYTKGLVHGGLGGLVGGGTLGTMFGQKGVQGVRDLAGAAARSPQGQRVVKAGSDILKNVRGLAGQLGPQSRSAMVAARRAMGRGGRSILQRLGGLKSVLKFVK